MSEYDPPTENLPIFDPVVFSTGDEPLTYNIAVKKFLKYPSAQGTENLQAINVNGISTFNAAANFNKPIVMSSATVADREIESSTYTVLNASNTDIGSVSYTSNSILYNSKINSGRQVFNNTTSLGVNLEVMAMTADEGVTMARPLVMTGTTLNRAITSSSYKMLSGTNVLSGEIAMSGADQIYYQNTINSGNHTFLTRNSGGTQTTPLKITSTGIDVNTIMNINNGATPYGVIGTSGPDQIYYQNTINSGSHNFLTRNSGGTQTIPFKITSTGIDVNTIMNINSGATPYGVIGTSGSNEIRHQNTINGGSIGFLTKSSGGLNSQLAVTADGLIMLTSGNYIQFPDGTQQTTAATTTPLKTYTEYYPSIAGNLPSKTITIPANCYAIDLIAISGGGNAGSNNGSFNGGGGGGGQVLKSTSRIFVSEGQQIIVFFATDNGGNFIRGENPGNNSVLIRSANPSEAGGSLTASIQIGGVSTSLSNVIGTLANGLNGFNATPSANGNAAPAGSASPTGNIFATGWDAYKTTGGVAGSPLSLTSGSPRGSRWLLNGYGMGGVSTATQPTSIAGNAVVMITYYIGN
jgi:hypothetical protein